MTEPFFDDNAASLPQELRELDAELGRIGVRERASFAPELRAELSLTWSEMKEASSSRRHGARALAVAAAAVLLLGLVFDSARASLIALIGALRPFEPVQVVEVGPVRPMVELSGAADTMLFPLVAEPAGQAAEVAAPDQVARVDTGALTVFEPADFTFPRVADPSTLQALLEEHYPAHLQSARVGGKVRVRMWVDPNGAPSLVQVRASSGIPDLDQAARDAAANLLFEPARWLGYPVGTWVEFDVGFDPAIAIAQ
jgi:TonB family protein